MAVDLDTDAVNLDTDAVNLDIDAVDLDIDAVNLDTDAVDLDIDAVRLDIDAVDLDIDAVDLDSDAVNLDIDAVDLGIDAVDLGIDAVDLDSDAVDLDSDAQKLACISHNLIEPPCLFRKPGTDVAQTLLSVLRPKPRSVSACSLSSRARPAQTRVSVPHRSCSSAVASRAEAFSLDDSPPEWNRRHSVNRASFSPPRFSAGGRRCRRRMRGPWLLQRSGLFS
ncbi:MAG TPA: hypothetical protein VLC46_08455 [Thermoanaerobaculia bacterium]|jgi:hypothetical protein|nr:hypothetical protein [Thermoanaerobaculia bacterium]